MEEDSNNVTLAKLGLVTPGEAFFYQRWSELLHSFTLDTYQVNVLSPRAALAELHDVLGDIQEFNMSEINLVDVIAETLHLMRTDPVLNTMVPEKTAALQLKIGGQVKGDRSYQISLRYHLKAFLDRVQPLYLGWAVDCLGAAIARGNLSEVDRLAGIVASESICVGWSQRGLYESRSHLLRRHAFDEAWRAFTGNLLGPKRDYTCLIPLDPNWGPPVQVSLVGMGITLRNGAEVDAEFPGLDIPEHPVFARVQVSAYDVYSAAFSAARKVTSVANALLFYDRTEVPTNISTVLLPDMIRRRLKRVDLREITDPQYKVDVTHRMTEPTERIWRDPMATDISRRLEGVFTYNALSKQAVSQETRFMNLWSAMESALRLKTTSTDVARIKDIVGSVHSLRYISRLFRNFGEDCRRCKVRVCRPKGRPATGSTRTDRTREVAEAFLTPETHAEMSNSCQVNALLSYRFAQLAGIVTDAARCRDVLSKHKEKVMWHIQRLYRLRNRIVHSAFSSETSMSLYLRNLHGYLNILMAEVIPYLDSHRTSDYEEAIQILLENYALTLNLLKRGTVSVDLLMGRAPEMV